MLKRYAPYPLWALLTLPALLWSYSALTSTNPRILHILVHPTGEWAARVLIITLMVTPLAILFKGTAFSGWLRQNRRYLGVASFGYALLHTVFYLLDKGSLPRVLGELERFYIWTGWLAFAIFLPLALTSMDYFVRTMGPHWKTLQRTTYIAALFTLLHWASLHNWRHPEAALAHFAPLVALELYRLFYWINRRRQRRHAQA